MSHAYIKEKNNGGIFKGALLSLFFTLAFSFFAIALCSALLMRAETPGAYIKITGILLPAFGALFGGIVSARMGGAGALSGLILGGMFIFVLFLLSLLTGAQTFSLLSTAVLYTALMLISVFGGTLGAHKKGKRHRRKRR